MNTTLTDDIVLGVVNDCIRGCDSRVAGPIAKATGERSTDFYIPILICPNSTKGKQRKMGVSISDRCRASHNGIGCTIVSLHQDVNDPVKGTILIRSF